MFIMEMAQSLFSIMIPGYCSFQSTRVPPTRAQVLQMRLEQIKGEDTLLMFLFLLVPGMISNKSEGKIRPRLSTRTNIDTVKSVHKGFW